MEEVVSEWAFCALVSELENEEQILQGRVDD